MVRLIFLRTAQLQRCRACSLLGPRRSMVHMLLLSEDMHCSD